MPKRPIIAIAGLACETSIFSPARTLASAFHPQCGVQIISKYDFLHLDTPLGEAAEWHGALIGHALPGGVVTRASFEELASEIMLRLTQICASTTLDGLWLDIHGAMCVEGMLDVEADLLRRIRRVIGPWVIVSASMDLHGNVSRDLVHQTDLITCYRMAPHEDELLTKERACRNLVGVLMKGAGSPTRPLKAWVPVPILLPGEQTSTRVEPAKSLYRLLPGIEDLPDVLDAAIWMGYPWADEPRNHAAVIVTGWDTDVVMNCAHILACHFWEVRGRFKFVAPAASLAHCIDTALVSDANPFFISDSGDNPTAGGAGDVTWTLARLLERPEFKCPNGPTVIYASIPGCQAIDVIVGAGVGATVSVIAGAEIDNLHQGPVHMTGRVHSIRHGDQDAVVEAVLQVGRVFVILTKFRKPYHRERDFTGLGLQPRAAKVVVVKIGYLEPELFNMAADWMLALTPGGVDQDLSRLGHQHIVRPMWPFDKEFSERPDFTPVMIPYSNQRLA